MALNHFFQHQSIKGKDVYVVDDHHKALAAWALIRRPLAAAPNLITLDHHTDTHEAFLRYGFWEHEKKRVPDADAFRSQLVAQIDYASDSTIEAAIANLKHDEHINAATMSRILGKAFCIQLSDRGGYQSIEEAEASESGSLDTLEREDVLDAWAKVATGRAWPCFGEGQPSREAFLDAYFLHLRQLGARRLGMPAPRSSL